MIHWVQWHLPNWSQPRGKEVGRGIRALKWIAPLGWPRGKFSSIWMDRSGCQTMWITCGERRPLLNPAPEPAWPCHQPWPALGFHFAQDHHIFVRNIGRSPDGKRGCSAFYSFLPSFEFCLFFSNLWKLCPSLSLLLLALPPGRWRKNLFKHPLFPTFLGPWDWLTSYKARRWQKDDFSILNNYSSSWIWQRRWVIWKLVYSHPNMALLFPPAPPHSPAESAPLFKMFFSSLVSWWPASQSRNSRWAESKCSWVAIKLYYLVVLRLWANYFSSKPQFQHLGDRDSSCPSHIELFWLLNELKHIRGWTQRLPRRWKLLLSLLSLNSDHHHLLSFLWNHHKDWVHF